MNTKKLIYGIFAFAILAIASCTAENDSDFYESGVDKRHIEKGTDAVDKRFIEKGTDAVDKRFIEKGTDAVDKGDITKGPNKKKKN